MNIELASKSQILYQKAKDLIPGGTQLLSKRPEMILPGQWPVYYKKARGCQIWDLDDCCYWDMSYMGIGSCLLGYADPDVNEAVKKAVDSGSMTTLNCPEEIELAEILCELHPWAEMVRYARTGGEAMAVGTRIARARTGQDIILFCGYHGWHDWYLSANISDPNMLNSHLLTGLEACGVPKGLQATAIPFQYNDLDSFLSLMKKYKNKIAAVIMEPIRNIYPKEGFLETIREETLKNNVLLVFDEITSGFRLNCGGAHLTLHVIPDMAVFGKGLSNGYPMAAIIGTKDVMQAAQNAFISSTYWTEKIGPTAALATIAKLKKYDVPQHLIDMGNRVREGWKSLAKKHNFNIDTSGIPPLAGFTFKYEKKELLLKTLFTQFMLDRGFLATTAFYAAFAHNEEIVDAYLNKVDGAFGLLSKAVQEEKLESYLKGPVCHAGFQRLI